MTQRTSEKVSELTLATSVAPTDMFAVAASGVSYRFPAVYVPYVSSMAALRAVLPVNGAVVRTGGFSTLGDGGGGTWRGITGAAPGTYTHDGGRVIVPSGGDGSSCWMDADPLGPRSVLRWGVKADGATDDTTALSAAIAAARLNGLALTAPVGTIKIADVALGNATKQWSLSGMGKGLTIFKRISGGTVMNCGGSSAPFTLSDFTLDCSGSSVPTGAHHGISIAYTTGVRIERVSVIDHVESGIQIYDDAGTHRYFDAQLTDCDTSGSGGNGQVGILVANMDRCVFTRCYATGCNALPGFALEFKDVCHDCHMVACVGANSLVLCAFSSDVAAPGVERSTVQGFTGKAGASTLAGYFGGYTQFCTFSGLDFDLNSVNAFGLRLQNDIGNAFSGVVLRNIGAARSAVYCDQASTDNYIELGHVANLNVTGNVVEFHNNATRNVVELRRMTTPNVRAAGLDTEANFNSSLNNSYEHKGYVMYEVLTLASDTVAPRNAATRLLTLLGEGGAADNIATIASTYVTPVQGKELMIKNVNSSPTLTVKNTGNIATAGAADFALDARQDTYTVRWVEDGLKWCEVARANNG